MKLLFATMILVSMLLFSSLFQTSVAYPSNFCDSKCGVRCSKAKLKDRCLKYCGICCAACHCIKAHLSIADRVSLPCLLVLGFSHKLESDILSHQIYNALAASSEILRAFHLYSDRFALWNPGTREFKPLPSHPITDEFETDQLYDEAPVVGFGHDPSTND
ncbi:hypothetical protein LguiA_033759 [Lonicera macranthoides]